jgi:hypothetical protein
MAERILDGGRRAQRLLRHSPVVLPTAIAAVALVTWIVTIDRMQGMDAGPGTNLGGLGWFVGVWATTMAAMMLASVMPMTLVFARASASISGAAEASSRRGCSSAAICGCWWSPG